MTLLITVFAAIFSTFFWYADEKKRARRIGVLCWMYWGASLMWLVDAVFEYAEKGEEFFKPEPIDMLHDSYLGLSVVALGCIVWLLILLIRDPEGVVRSRLIRKK